VIRVFLYDGLGKYRQQVLFIVLFSDGDGVVFCDLPGLRVMFRPQEFLPLEFKLAPGIIYSNGPGFPNRVTNAGH